MTLLNKEHEESFELANRAFEQCTLAERASVLRVFASLTYPSMTDRFIEAVHRVIVAVERTHQ